MNKLLSKILVLISVCIIVMSVCTCVFAVSTRNETLELTDTKGTIENVSEGWSWDLSTYTLTLNGVNFDFNIYNQLKFDGVPRTRFTIVVNGENTIKCGETSGIYVLEAQNLEIKGEGTLNITGNCTSGIFVKNICNLQISNNVKINIDATYGTAYPICVENGTLEINNSYINIKKSSSNINPIIFAKGGITLNDCYIETLNAKIHTLNNINDRIISTDGTHLENLVIIQEMQRAINENLMPDELKNLNLKEKITREEFASVAIKLYEALTKNISAPANINTFTDTKNEYVLKAYNLGIVKGMGNGLFDPNGYITREEMATMMTRTIAVSRSNVDITKYEGINLFADDNLMSNWAKSSIYFMAQKGIIKGVGDNMFSPKGASATREQALAISVRCLECFR